MNDMIILTHFGERRLTRCLNEVGAEMKAKEINKLIIGKISDFTNSTQQLDAITTLIFHDPSAKTLSTI